MQGRCGKVAAAAGGALRRRTVAALLRFGALLEPGEAIKPLKQLLRVCRVVLAERGPSRSVHLQRQLLSYHARTAALRSGGRQKLLPRVTLLRKLQLRHLQRLAASAFGCGSRCAELLPLVDLAGRRTISKGEMQDMEDHGELDPILRQAIRAFASKPSPALERALELSPQ